MKKNLEPRTQNLVVSQSETETMQIAERFAKTLRGGEIILLEGDLGSGKTTFVRGMARAFGIKEPIRSPTFTLLHIYRVKIQNSKFKIQNLVHVDAYRLRGAKDLRALGLEEYLGREDTIVVVEWGQKARTLVRGLKTQQLSFTLGARRNKRHIKIYDRTINP